MAESTKIKVYSVAAGDYVLTEKVQKTEEEWRRQLTPEQYQVLREQGTECAFTGATWDNKEHGLYRCAGCGLDLYQSDSKYQSGTGWPSFFQPVAAENIAVREDRSFIMTRNELICRRCEGHLGHVFGDGPKPTGQRHCINAASLEFVKLDP
ncbi:MAG TPA: peptide-methionine (R)-S-oxide reductase MsrB [Malonomonas sp.]